MPYLGVNLQHSKDAISAPDLSIDNIPLPPKSATAKLVYEGKASEEEILSEHYSHFRTISVKGKASRKSLDIPDNSFVLTDNFVGLHTLLNSGKKVDLFLLRVSRIRCCQLHIMRECSGRSTVL